MPTSATTRSKRLTATDSPSPPSASARQSSSATRSGSSTARARDRAPAVGATAPAPPAPPRATHTVSPGRRSSPSNAPPFARLTTVPSGTGRTSGGVRGAGPGPPAPAAASLAATPVRGAADPRVASPLPPDAALYVARACRWSRSGTEASARSSTAPPSAPGAGSRAARKIVFVLRPSFLNLKLGTTRPASAFVISPRPPLPELKGGRRGREGVGVANPAPVPPRSHHPPSRT